MDEPRSAPGEPPPAGRPPEYGAKVARYLICCALGGVVAVLFVGLWWPWLYNLSAWDQLRASGDAGVHGRVWWVIVLVPVTVVLYVVALVWPRRLARLPLLLVTLVGAGCVTGIGGFGGSDGWAGRGPGAALVGYPLALLLSLALIVLSGPERLVAGARPGWLVVAAGLVPVLVAAGLVAAGGSGWAGLRVDSTTAGAAVPAVTGSPGDLSGQSPDNGLTGPFPLAGGLVAVTRGSYAEVTVFDAATGRPRWHYFRHDAELGSMAASRDERTLVAVFKTQARSTVVGFDAATGAVRWQWWAPPHALRVVALPDVTVAVTPDEHGTAVALDPSTGRRRWSLRGLWPAKDDRACGIPADIQGSGTVAGDADLTAVVVACGGLAPTLVIHAVDRTGRQRWTWTDRLRFGSPYPWGELLSATSGAVLLWSVDPDQITALSPATGRVDWSVDDDTYRWAASGGDTVLLVDVHQPARLRQVDATTGAPTATQPPVTPSTDLGDTIDGPGPPDVTDLRDGTTVAFELAIRAGRLYWVHVLPNGGTVLTVLDLPADRTLGTYPVRATGPAGPYRGEEVVPGPGYAVVGMAHSTARGPSLDVTVRLPGS